MKLQEYNRNKDNVRRVVECIITTKPPYLECKTCCLSALCFKVRLGLNREKMTLVLDDAIVTFAKVETKT